MCLSGSEFLEHLVSNSAAEMDKIEEISLAKMSRIGRSVEMVRKCEDVYKAFTHKSSNTTGNPLMLPM